MLTMQSIKPHFVTSKRGCCVRWTNKVLEIQALIAKREVVLHGIKSQRILLNKKEGKRKEKKYPGAEVERYVGYCWVYVEIQAQWDNKK